MAGGNKQEAVATRGDSGVDRHTPVFSESVPLARNPIRRSSGAGAAARARCQVEQNSANVAPPHASND